MGTLDLLGEKSSLIPTEVGVRMVEAHSQARILPRLTGLLPIFAGRWLSLSSRAAFANARSYNCHMPSELRNLYPCSSKPTALSRRRSQLRTSPILSRWSSIAAQCDRHVAVLARTEISRDCGVLPLWSR